MFAKKVWLIVAMTLFAVQVNAEQIKVAYSGVSAAGTPLWLAKEEGIFPKHRLDADLVAVRSAPVKLRRLSPMRRSLSGEVFPVCLRPQRKGPSLK